jgi:beta-alanine degradation protein BauB
MALTMLDKKAVQTAQTAWRPEIAAEFERERKSPNGCVGQRLLSESERARVWEIRLKPGERFGFHRHVLDYFWSALNAGRARAHLDDGATVEHTYTAGETRHEAHAAGHFKVHDLENIGDTELIFTTVEFLDGANAPLPVPHRVRYQESDVRDQSGALSDP